MCSVWPNSRRRIFEYGHERIWRSAVLRRHAAAICMQRQRVVMAIFVWPSPSAVNCTRSSGNTRLLGRHGAPQMKLKLWRVSSFCGYVRFYVHAVSFSCSYFFLFFVFEGDSADVVVCSRITEYKICESQSRLKTKKNIINCFLFVRRLLDRFLWRQMSQPFVLLSLTGNKFAWQSDNNNDIGQPVEYDIWTADVHWIQVRISLDMPCRARIVCVCCGWVRGWQGDPVASY